MTEPIPVWASWEVDTACNLKCIHCRVDYHEKPNLLTTEEGKSLIDQFADLKILRIGFTGGEPFLRKDLLELMEYASENGIRVGVTTNGLLINEKTLAKIARIEEFEVLQFSLDGSTAATHDYVRGIRGTFDSALKAIKESVATGITTGVVTTLMKVNYNEIPQILQLLLDLGVKTWGARRFMPCGRGSEMADSLMVSPLMYKDFCHMWCQKRKELEHKLKMIVEEPLLTLVEEPGFYPSDLYYPGCRIGTTYFAISASGDVIPCMFLPIRLGNVREQSVGSILSNSLILKSIRERKNLQGKCGVCKYRELCGGCRANAFYHTGNFLGEDNTCWLETV